MAEVHGLTARSRQCAQNPGTTGETAGVGCNDPSDVRRRPAISRLDNWIIGIVLIELAAVRRCCARYLGRAAARVFLVLRCKQWGIGHKGYELCHLGVLSN
ncbi:MAG: hypothetical protein ACOX0T_02985 [Pelotomaculum sp.]